MASKLIDLTELVAAAGEDLIYITDDPSGAALDRKITLDNLFSRTMSAANKSGLSIAGYSLTGSDASSLVDLSGTWNTTGTPTAIKLDITNTASNASSLLMDLKVDGTTEFLVELDGTVATTEVYVTGTPSAGANNTDAGRFYTTGGAGAIALRENSFNTYFLAGAQFFLDMGVSATRPGFCLGNDAFLGFTVGSGGASIQSASVRMYCDEAYTLAIRNNTNAMGVDIYNTTDGTNYERLEFGWASNRFDISSVSAGTGTDRDIAILLPVAGDSEGGRLYLGSTGSWCYNTGGRLWFDNSANGIGFASQVMFDHRVVFDPASGTISGGILNNVNSVVITADTEGAASTDDLDSMNNAINGRIVVLKAADSARTVVVKHGTGNLILAGGADFSLDHVDDRIVLIGDGTNFVEICRASNGT